MTAISPNPHTGFFHLIWVTNSRLSPTTVGATSADWEASGIICCDCRYFYNAQPSRGSYSFQWDSSSQYSRTGVSHRCLSCPAACLVPVQPSTDCVAFPRPGELHVPRPNCATKRCGRTMGSVPMELHQLIGKPVPQPWELLQLFEEPVPQSWKLRPLIGNPAPQPGKLPQLLGSGFHNRGSCFS